MAVLYHRDIADLSSSCWLAEAAPIAGWRPAAGPELPPAQGNRAALELVRLNALMANSVGRPEVIVGLIDGPVSIAHPDLAAERVREATEGGRVACARASSAACRHGTFIAGMLGARRNSPAPAICPGCTMLLRPIFVENGSSDEGMPSATPDELAEALLECVHAGARLINLSAAIGQPSMKSERHLQQVLDHAARCGTIVVAAAGNQGIVGSSPITRHPWVIPVSGCDMRGRPLGNSNLGISIARRGLRAPADGIRSLSPDCGVRSFGGTSVATPFVTGALALLWSAFPAASATELKLAVAGPGTLQRTSVVPPLLDASAAFHALARSLAGRGLP